MITATARWAYDFAEGSREMRELLGGKGAGIAEMTRVLGPELVPAGFTITTDACVAYMRAGKVPEGFGDTVDAAIARLEAQAGKQFGDPSDPLLVSVRSGARDSMPGMMDTVLNLGLNDESVQGLAAGTGRDRFAWDSYRRLVQMFGDVVCGVPGVRFEDEIAALKTERGVRLDTELDTDALVTLTRRFQALYDFPHDPREQLERAIRAVFDSWMGARAVAYRRINAIPDEWGTAVNVQQMVFGNKGPRSGSGVAFSRDEVTGAPEPSGDFLVDAQGEDVVSGVRTPRDLSELAAWMPDAYAQLLDIMRVLERHYRDMQDTEFTIEDGRLYMLQTRSAKRPAQAAVRFAVDAVDEGLLTPGEAIMTIDTGGLDALLHPTFDPTVPYSTVSRAASLLRPARPRARSSSLRPTPWRPPKPVGRRSWCGRSRRPTMSRASTPPRASSPPKAARPRTPPWSPAGWAVRRSPARAASRSTCMPYRPDRRHRPPARATSSASTVRPVRSRSTTCRSCGRASTSGSRASWRGATSIRTLGVRANADTPEDARRARAFGAEGIGLCRTEHMFMAAGRQPKMQRMIMADDEASRRDALLELLPLQQADFEGLLEAMAGMPVTIRLLDPPLHEFMPDEIDLAERLSTARATASADVAGARAQLERVRALAEGNPMLGTRGVRLGLIHPDIYEMQARAIFRAASAVQQRGHEPARLEIMVPLIAYPRELALARLLIERVAAEEGFPLEAFEVGSMIELPRACLRAGEIAAIAEFFSFGTNDLTQTALGFSRDDIEGRLVPLVRRQRHPRTLAVRHDRRRGRRRARPHRRRARPRRAAAARAGHLRRARRRPDLDPTSSTAPASTT